MKSLNNLYLAAGLLACLILPLAGLLISAWRGRGIADEIDILRKTAQAARNPWAKEETDLQELARRVEDLQKPPGDNQPNG